MRVLISILSLSFAIFILSGFGGRPPRQAPSFVPSDRTDHWSGLRSASQTSFNGACSQVHVDCSTHRIRIIGASISSADQVIDCGKNGTTKNGEGTIGGLHRGRTVKDGVRIEGILGMGDSGGGRVFHTAWWNPGQMPTGVNSSKGCIRVSPNVLKILKKCKGARLSITGATDRSRMPKNRSKTRR